jgi:hypothetical protein
MEVGMGAMLACADGTVGPRAGAASGIKAAHGLSAETPNASAAPVSIDAAVRCRLRRRRCLVSMGRSSTG